MMDPDIALDIIREAWRDVVAEKEKGKEIHREDIHLMLEAFGKLDRWLSSGGTLPRDWKKEEA